MTDFELFRISNGLRKSFLSEYLGVSNSFVTQLVQGSRSLPEDKLKLIKANDKGWDVSMLKPSDGLSESVRARIRSESVQPVSADTYVEVPFYDLSVTAGLPNGEGQAGWLDTRLVPARFAGQDFVVVKVSGDSMNDGSARAICEGDELVVKFEPLDLAGGLPIRTRLFVVDTTEGAVVKQIAEFNRTEGYIVLRSFNKDYPDYSLSLNEVRGFYSVQCCIYRSIRF